MSEVNQRGQVSSIKTYDFSTLYTNLPHKELKERIPRLGKESFEGPGKKYISVDRHYNTIRTKSKRCSRLLLSCEDVEAMLPVLLDKVFIHVGRKVFQQCVGIPMGTNCAPPLAELLLHDYESGAMIRFSRTNGHSQAKSFEFTRRSLISVNNNGFDKAIEKIYSWPSELTLKDTTPADGKVACLERQIEVRDRQLIMSLYDKSDSPFAIHNYPNLDSNVPCMPTYHRSLYQLTPSFRPGLRHVSRFLNLFFSLFSQTCENEWRYACVLTVRWVKVRMCRNACE